MKCPFGKIKCEECELNRSGVRFFDDGRKEPFVRCTLHVVADCLENLVARSIGQQKAIEEVRNETNQLRAMFESLAQMKRLE